MFKQAYALSISDIKDRHKKVIEELENVETKREKEQEFEHVFQIPKGHVIVDMPAQELERAEPRIHKTNIGVIEHDEMKTLDHFTPVAKAIRSRIAPDWTIMIVTDEKYRKIVSEKAETILFS